MLCLWDHHDNNALFYPHLFHHSIVNIPRHERLSMLLMFINAAPLYVIKFTIRVHPSNNAKHHQHHHRHYNSFLTRFVDKIYFYLSFNTLLLTNAPYTHPPYRIYFLRSMIFHNALFACVYECVLSFCIRYKLVSCRVFSMRSHMSRLFYKREGSCRVRMAGL